MMRFDTVTFHRELGSYADQLAAEHEARIDQMRSRLSEESDPAAWNLIEQRREALEAQRQAAVLRYAEHLSDQGV